ATYPRRSARRSLIVSIPIAGVGGLRGSGRACPEGASREHESREARRKERHGAGGRGDTCVQATPVRETHTSSCPGRVVSFTPIVGAEYSCESRNQPKRRFEPNVPFVRKLPSRSLGRGDGPRSPWRRPPPQSRAFAPRSRDASRW